MKRDVRRVQAAYPAIYFACHVRHQRARSSAVKLSAADSGLLAHLDEERATSPAALARHLGIGAPALSASVARLARLGYLDRRPSARDRRRVELRLTEQGAAAMQAGSVLDAERVAIVLDRLGAAERRRAVDGLELLARASHDAMDAHQKGRAR